MEARTFAKVNKSKSDQLQRDIDAFVAAGGCVQVLPTQHAAPEQEAALKKAAGAKRIYTRKNRKKNEIDAPEELEPELASPSTETPVEEIETRIE